MTAAIAMPGGKYPISDQESANNAWNLRRHGKGVTEQEVVAHIRRACAKLGLRFPGGKVDLAADSEHVPSSGRRDANWVSKAGGLPEFINRIAKDLMDKGMAESHAIATAVNQCKKWAAGGKDVKPQTRAKAAAAVAEWEAKKGMAHASLSVPTRLEPGRHGRVRTVDLAAVLDRTSQIVDPGQRAQARLRVIDLAYGGQAVDSGRSYTLDELATKRAKILMRAAAKAKRGAAGSRKTKKRAGKTGKKSLFVKPPKRVQPITAAGVAAGKPQWTHGWVPANAAAAAAVKKDPQKYAKMRAQQRSQQGRSVANLSADTEAVLIDLADGQVVFNMEKVRDAYNAKESKRRQAAYAKQREQRALNPMADLPSPVTEPRYRYVKEVWNTHLIVKGENDSDLHKVPYEVGADGVSISFGKEVPVTQQYVELSHADEADLIAEWDDSGQQILTSTIDLAKPGQRYRHGWIPINPGAVRKPKVAGGARLHSSARLGSPAEQAVHARIDQAVARRDVKGTAAHLTDLVKHADDAPDDTTNTKHLYAALMEAQNATGAAKGAQAKHWKAVEQHLSGQLSAAARQVRSHEARKHALGAAKIDGLDLQGHRDRSEALVQIPRSQRTPEQHLQFARSNAVLRGQTPPTKTVLPTGPAARTTADNPFAAHSTSVLKEFTSGQHGPGPWHQNQASREAGKPWGTMEHAQAELAHRKQAAKDRRAALPGGQTVGSTGGMTPDRQQAIIKAATHPHNDRIAKIEKSLHEHTPTNAIRDSRWRRQQEQEYQRLHTERGKAIWPELSDEQARYRSVQDHQLRTGAIQVQKNWQRPAWYTGPQPKIYGGPQPKISAFPPHTPSDAKPDSTTPMRDLARIATTPGHPHREAARVEAVTRKNASMGKAADGVTPLASTKTEMPMADLHAMNDGQLRALADDRSALFINQDRAKNILETRRKTGNLGQVGVGNPVFERKTFKQHGIKHGDPIEVKVHGETHAGTAFVYGSSLGVLKPDGSVQYTGGSATKVHARKIDKAPPVTAPAHPNAYGVESATGASGTTLHYPLGRDGKRIGNAGFYVPERAKKFAEAHRPPREASFERGLAKTEAKNAAVDAKAAGKQAADEIGRTMGSVHPEKFKPGEKPEVHKFMNTERLQQIAADTSLDPRKQANAEQAKAILAKRGKSGPAPDPSRGGLSSSNEASKAMTERIRKPLPNRAAKPGKTKSGLPVMAHPTTPDEKMAALRTIVKGNAHEITGVVVDMQTANVALKVLEALSPANREKMLAMPFHNMLRAAWKLVK